MQARAQGLSKTERAPCFLQLFDLVQACLQHTLNPGSLRAALLVHATYMSTHG